MKHHSLSGCILMQNGSVFHYSIGKTQAQANFMISYQFPCSFFMGRFHARMKICPQKATEGVCILLYCKWRGKLVTDTRKTVNSLMPPRQNKKQRRCAEYRQEHLPEEHALEQSGNAGERQDEKNEEQPHGEGQDLEQKSTACFSKPV